MNINYFLIANKIYLKQKYLIINFINIKKIKMMEEQEMEINEEQNNINESNQLEGIKEIFEKNSRRFKDTGFYDKKYYEKLDLINFILEFIKRNFKKHYPPNEKIVIDLPLLVQLKELIEILFAYFNVLPPMQKKCLDKNINDLINNNILKKSELTKRISFIERDVKKAKYNLLSKKDLYELLKQRGLE